VSLDPALLEPEPNEYADEAPQNSRVSIAVYGTMSENISFNI
jgi:hypothetical protein